MLPLATDEEKLQELWKGFVKCAPAYLDRHDLPPETFMEFGLTRKMLIDAQLLKR